MESKTPLPVSQLFKNPPPGSFPGVYWFWHHIPSLPQIEQQLNEIQQAGYRTFLIQPRLAFPLHDYLSPGYLDAYRGALRIARRLGLNAGLYDDYNWISGHAGGRTVQGNDHLRERHLFWCASTLERGRAICSISGIHNKLGDGLGEAFGAWIYEGGQPIWDEWQVVHAFITVPGGGEMDVTGQTRIAGNSGADCRVEVNLTDERYNGEQATVFVSARCRTSRLVNYLHPGTTARFIEAGYEPYRRALEEFFGDPLTFVFFDQPYAGFYTWNEHFGNPLNSLMYDESLAQAFLAARGYDLGHALLGLVSPEDARTPRLRCDFYDTYGELARQRFLAPLADWANRHGLGFTGHELLGFVGAWGFAEGLPALDSRANFGADYFVADSYKTISSVDAYNYHPQISARFGCSVAHAHGRRECIIEQYSVPIGRDLPAPAGQWDLTLDDLRSQAIRHALFGAGKLIFHGFYQTNSVDRDAAPMRSPRFDFPPGINYMPWFRFHHLFAGEFARLNTFLAQAEPLHHTVLLYPLRAYWHGGPGHAFNAESHFWNRWLSENRVGYDIIDESQLDAARLLEHGVRLLVIPAASVVRDEGFAAQLEAFAANGGWVIASGPLPCATQQGGAAPAMETRLAALFTAHERMFHYADWKVARDDPELLARITHMLPGIKIHVADGLEHPLWAWQGEMATGKALALFNDSLEERLVYLHLPGSWLPVLYSPATGDCGRWGWYDRDPEHTRVYLPLMPREIVCLTLEPDSERHPLPHLTRLTGAARLARASVQLEGTLALTLHCDQPGRVRLTIASAARPVLALEEGLYEITQLSPETWQVEIVVPELPGPIPLDAGWRLRIPGEFHDVPVDIGQGWEQKYPNYAGSGYYRNSFRLREGDLAFRWRLGFERVITSLVGYVNQVRVGACGWPPYRLILPSDALNISYNQIEVAVWNTAGNAFYNNTPYQRPVLHPAGLAGAPGLEPFVEINLLAANYPKEGES